MKRSSLLKFPGLIDVHVHLREPGGIYKEDFSSGTKAAIAGGYTQILDMPNNDPPTDSIDALNDKIIRAKGRIWCDIGFNFGATVKSSNVNKKIYKKAFGLKVYMSQTTGPLLINKNNDREEIIKNWNSKVPIMVHAKDELVEIAIKLAKKYKRRIHICHLTGNQIKSVKKAKKDNVKITTEVTPHHLFLNKTHEKKLGGLGNMKPPLETKLSQQKLWDYLNNIDIISTDHAPHTIAEKKSESPPFGVPGLETTLPLLFQAKGEGLIKINQIKEKLCTNPRKIFNLPTQSSTYILINANIRYKIKNMKLFTKCQWTPFKDFYGAALVEKVVIRGVTVYENGLFSNKPIGKVIYPK